MLSICRRPYWSRLWIIQEILSASSVDVLCGSRGLHWDEFWAGMQVIASLKIVTEGLEGTCTSTPAYAIARKASSRHQNYDIEELVRLCLICEDIRDKIYGLLNLSKNVKIAPDYSKSSLEVHIDAFQAYLSINQSTSHGYQTLLETHQYYLLDDGDFLHAVRKILDDPLRDPNKRKIFPATCSSNRFYYQED